jgi:hypothetical protein
LDSNAIFFASKSAACIVYIADRFLIKKLVKI